MEAEFLDIIEGFFQKSHFHYLELCISFELILSSPYNVLFLTDKLKSGGNLAWSVEKLPSQLMIFILPGQREWKGRTPIVLGLHLLPDRFSPRQRPIRKIDFSATYLWLESLVFRVMMFQ